jgi:hypothetical protein
MQFNINKEKSTVDLVLMTQNKTSCDAHWEEKNHLVIWC